MALLDIQASAPATCSVIENHSAAGAHWMLRIEAVRDLSGRYSLKVQKSDLAGTATMQQSGRFDVAAGRTREVGQLATSTTTSQFQVDGHLDVDGQRISCARVTQDEL